MVTNYKYCEVCHKQISPNFILANSNICKYCFQKMPLIYKSFKIDGIDCMCLYKYNQTVREIILRIKGYYDIELAKVFITPIRNYLKFKYLNYTILPAPSTKSSNTKRGFNHVVEMFKPLGFPILNCFKKKSNYKQSDQSKYNRLNISNIIQLDTSNLSLSKKYLIVDDIATTSNTIRTCIRLLKLNNINNIKVLLISKKI